VAGVATGRGDHASTITNKCMTQTNAIKDALKNNTETNSNLDYKIRVKADGVYLYGVDNKGIETIEYRLFTNETINKHIHAPGGIEHICEAINQVNKHKLYLETHSTFDAWVKDAIKQANSDGELEHDWLVDVGALEAYDLTDDEILLIEDHAQTALDRILFKKLDQCKAVADLVVYTDNMIKKSVDDFQKRKQ
jgi:hypothetical protein